MQKLIFFISSLLVLAILSACGNEGNVDEDDFSSYPEENITLIVPWGAGGDTDIIARTVNKYLEEELDTTIVTQNIGGGGGVIGGQEGLTADPDGYTLINAHDSVGIANLMGTSDYDYFDFEPVSLLSTASEIIVTNADNDWDDMTDVIEQVESEPESISFGATLGSTSHIIPLGIMEDQNVEFNIVNYDGTAERTQAILGNHLDLGTTTVPAAKEYIESGDLKLLGIVTDERSDDLSEVPTLIEQGIDFSFGTNRGYFFPQDTPQEIVEIVSEALGNIAVNEDFQEEMENQGVDINYKNHEEYIEFLQEDLERFEELLINQGIID